MFSKIRYGLIFLCLLFPLTTQARPCSSEEANKLGPKVCDVTFTAIPTFANICLGTTELGIYTIVNNTPVTLLLNYIQIVSGDSLPAVASAIITVPGNNCGTSLASGASCNIGINLLPLALGTFNRQLQIGIDSRQVQLNAPTITTSVPCTTAIPPAPPTPVGPAPTTLPTAQLPVQILGASTVTNAGTTFVNGDVDVSPGTAITGFPPGTISGSFNAGNPTAATAQAFAHSYYTSAIGLPCGTVLTGQDLGGMTLAPGVYCFGATAQLTGALVLAGAPNGAYVFQVGTSLTTASNASVILTGGQTASNVTWAVGTSATIGSGTAFIGIVDAVASITFNTGASLNGRAWAQNAAVTLADNLISPTS
jgi:hypothetical protein